MSLKNDPKAYKVVGCAMKVHAALGSGFLESAYGDALEIEFEAQGVPYKREDEIKMFYCGRQLKTCYRADFTCYNGSLIVELKALKKIGAIEAAQTIHYLRATSATSAVLINFGAESLQYDYFPESFKCPQRSVSAALAKSGFASAVVAGNLKC